MGERLERTPSRRVNGRFCNPPGAPQPDCGAREFWKFLWRRARDGGRASVPDGHILPPSAVRAGLKRHEHGAALTWLGHAAFLTNLGGKRMLTDPFLSAVAAPRPALAPRRFAPAALGPRELPDIDVLLVSHNHYDHLDAATVGALRGKSRIEVVVPLGLGGFFRRRGDRKVREVDWWQSVTVGELRVTAVPAIHFSRRGPFDANRSLWAGFVIEDGSGYRLYFAGDTAYGPAFREIGAAFGGIDCALVPIGAYAPRSVMRGAHVNPEEAADICADVGACMAVAMHWGSIVLTEEPAFEPPVRFRTAMHARGFDADQTQVPAIGETLALKGASASGTPTAVAAAD